MEKISRRSVNKAAALATSLAVLLGIVGPQSSPAFAAIAEIGARSNDASHVDLSIAAPAGLSQALAPAVSMPSVPAPALSQLPTAAALDQAGTTTAAEAKTDAVGASAALHGLTSEIESGARTGGTAGAAATAAAADRTYDQSALETTRDSDLPPMPETDFVKDSATAYPTRKTPPFAALLKVVADPQEGFLSKIMIARNAKRTLDVNTYILTPSPVGYAYIHELKLAYERGVSVRLLVDSLGSLNPRHPTHPELKALLNAKPGTGLDGKKATIEVVMFNSLLNVPFAFEMIKRASGNLLSRLTGGRTPHLGHIYRWRDRRSHDKSWAADLDDPMHAVSVLGGRNLDDNYYGVPEVTPKTYHDMEIIVRNNPAAVEGSGSLATTLLPHFERLYYHLGNKTLKPNRSDRTQTKQKLAMIKGLRATILDNASVLSKFKAMEAADYLWTGYSKVSAHFVNEIENITRHHAFVDPQGRFLNRPNPDSLMANLSAKARRAKKSMVFVSPYLTLTMREVKWLKAWLDADPERTLKIVSNSIASGDDMPAQTLVDHVMTKYFLGDPTWKAKDQVKLYHFNGPGKLHAKFAIIDGELDGEWVGEVGSANADRRSRYLNSEHGMIFKSADGKPIQDLMASAQSLIDNSYAAGTPEWAAARKPHWVKRLQEQVYRVLFWIVPPIKDMV